MKRTNSDYILRIVNNASTKDRVMNWFALNSLNHSYYPNGCAPDVYLPIKPNGQSNWKKLAIICRVLARAIRSERVLPKGCIKRHFAAVYSELRIYLRRATLDCSFKTPLLLLDIQYLCRWSVTEPGKIYFIIVHEMDRRIVGFQEGLTVKTISSSLDALSIALVVWRCWSESLKVVTKCQNN